METEVVSARSHQLSADASSDDIEISSATVCHLAIS